MTKYEKLKTMADNFRGAASRATSNFMLALWTIRAEDTEKKLDKITNKEASEIFNPKLVVINAMEKKNDRLHNN